MKEAGLWITRFDLVERGSRLLLVEQDSVGKCGTECRTVARACSAVLGEHDTDLAEALFVDPGLGRAQLEQLLCRELSGACRGAPPPLPPGRPEGPPFEALSAQEAEMEALMRRMGDVPGMPGAAAQGGRGVGQG